MRFTSHWDSLADAPTITVDVWDEDARFSTEFLAHCPPTFAQWLHGKLLLTVRNGYAMYRIEGVRPGGVLLMKLEDSKWE